MAALDQQQQQFGHAVLGPIASRFARDLILWTRASPLPDRTAVLFAARGGLRLQSIAESFAKQTGFSFGSARTAGLMVSRLAVMRAFLGRTEAAMAEFCRYCENRNWQQVLGLLIPDSARVDPGDLPMGPVDRSAITALLKNNNFLSERVRDEISSQEALLLSHLDEISAGRDHILFVDTGLFGSTFNVLAKGMPQWQTATLLMGRCFYRTPEAHHADRTFGLLFQSERVTIANPISAVLRHWYLIESLMEPDIASVTRYEGDPVTGRISPDSRETVWIERIKERSNPIFDGLMNYLEELQPGDLVDVDRRAKTASFQLARMILMPNHQDVAILSIAPQEPSPGDEDIVRALKPIEGQNWQARFKSLSEARWQEGQARLAFPGLASALLPIIAMARMARSLV